MVFKNKEDFNFVGSSYDAASLMTINNLHCMFNMPKAIKKEPKYEIKLVLLNEDVEYVKDSYYKRKFNSGEEAEKFIEEAGLRTLRQYHNVEVVEAEEEVSGLPPYAPRKAFKVDEYNCPTSWMHGSGLASSYFVPIEAEHGMWLDFNRNSGHTHHIAIVISVQGVNPLDGQSMVEGALNLKQYKTKCPVHDIEFGGDRFCSKCGYKWVPQNYLCTTGTPSGSLWLDGFLAADGVVRQYYFTEDEAKGVAHQIIGAEKKVYSIGVAFYLSKNPKPVPTYSSRTTPLLGFAYGGPAVQSQWMSKSIGHGPVHMTNSVQHTNKSRNILRRNKSATVEVSAACNMNDLTACDSYGDTETDFDSQEFVKSLDIAAGAKINQKVYADPESLDFWQETPAGMLYINYTPSEQAIAILKKGKKDLTKKGEGFLAGLKK